MTIRFALAFALVVIAGRLQLAPRPESGGPAAGRPGHHQRPGRAGRAGRRVQRASRASSYYGGDFVDLRRPAGRQRRQHRHLAGLRRRRRQPVPGRQRDGPGHLGRRSTMASTGSTSFSSGCRPLTDLEDTEKDADPGRGALPPRAALPQPGQAVRRRADPAHAGQGRRTRPAAPSGARWPTSTPRSWPTWARRAP